jgi:hypothetical protein
VDSDNVDTVVAEVNEFVARQLWMDFSVWSYHGDKLEVSGTRDESYWSDLRVVFNGVCWVCIRFQGWRTEPTRPVLLRVDGSEAHEVKARFQIEVGHHLFKLVAEDFEQPMWVAAQGITADFTRLELGAG